MPKSIQYYVNIINPLEYARNLNMNRKINNKVYLKMMKSIEKAHKVYV